jgi:hypothetical protein
MAKRILLLALLTVSVNCRSGDQGPATEKPAESSDLFGMPVEMRVPVPPTPFRAGGKTHLAYELHITNFGNTELLIRKLELLISGSAVAAFEGDQLDMMLERVGTRDTGHRSTVGAGQRAIAYVWISADPGTEMPPSIQHRITGLAQAVEGGTTRLSTMPPAILGPPLRGPNWVAVNGPDNASGHRRALQPFNGSTAIGQRFATDWLQSGPDGKTFDGDPKDVRSYRAYAEELLAVADGVVVFVKDGIPDNVPGPTSRAVPIGPETIAGNVIVLDIGGGRFAFYGHVQPGTLRVKAGEKVRRGQVMGLVGNSGNSDEPHLHFHVGDSSTLLEAEGIPYVIDSFEMMTAPSVWQRVQKELPLQGSIVRFSP